MFTFFNVRERKAVAGEEFTLTLSGLTYDEAWNLVTVPISGASITEFYYVTTAVTDAEGKAVITLGKPGRYIVSAKSSGAAIVPPSCVVTVSDTTLLDERIEAAAAYIAGTAASPVTGAAGNDWAIFALARSGYDLAKAT